MTLMSQAEYARAEGVTRQAVHKAVKRLGVTRHGPTKKIDPEELRAALASERDPARDGQRKIAAAPAETEAGASAPASGANGSANGAATAGDFQKARAEREKARALSAQLDLRERIGELVSVAEVQAVALEQGRRLRDKLTQAFKERALELATETDEKRLAAAAKAILDETFTDFAGYVREQGGDGGD